MPSQNLHVLIIGGGIGGLCLAQGLRRSGVSVAVYERDRTPDAGLQGYCLSIEPPGSAALHECLPPELWQILVASSGDQGERMGVFDEQLRELMEEDPKAGATDPASGSHAISRVTLRQVLLAGLGDSVHFGRGFVRYVRTADGRVTAYFADGSPATGDVLVGADGARSRVRRQLLPNARRIDTPAIGVGGKLPLTGETRAWLPGPLMTAKNMVLPPRDFLFTAVFRRRQQPSDVAARLRDPLRAMGPDADQLVNDTADNDYLMWAFVAHRRSYPSDSSGLRGKALREIVEQLMASWHPALPRLVAESDPDTIEQFDFAAAARMRPWPNTRVTLLGDAIHYMPPVGGMGGNTALADTQRLCAALARLAGGGAPLTAALRDYEQEMLDRGFNTVRGVRGYTRMAISRSRLLRATARGFFWLCGAAGPLRRAVFSD